MDIKLVNKLLLEDQVLPKSPILNSTWEYVITPTENSGYGNTLIVYKDGVEVKKQSGYGSPQMAKVSARDYVLFEEFGIERDTD
jgi:hypothetical protein